MKFSKVLFVFSLLAAFSSVGISQELKPDEIIAKHLEAIGSKEARANKSNFLVAGINEFRSKLPSITGGGKALIVSDADNFYFLISLNSKEYPFDKIGFFNKKSSLPFTTAGARSPLGGFIADHPKLLEEGLFFGSMSSRWNLLDTGRYGGKIRSGGTKKIDNRKVYVLEYYPSDGASSEFKIRFYIDAETFNHVRTEYHHQITPKQDVFGTLGRQAGAILELTEDFKDFRSVDGLTLPHNYNVNFRSSSQSGTFEYDWTIKVVQYYFNQKLAPDFYTFDTK